MMGFQIVAAMDCKSAPGLRLDTKFDTKASFGKTWGQRRHENNRQGNERDIDMKLHFIVW